jgi:D-alanyl-D-alanine carboxypeptidase
MTPETETTEIILPEETVIPIPEPEPTLPTSSEAERFPVVRGLMIVGFILVALFGSIIVPKTISYLHLAKEEAPQFVPLPEIAAVTTARDPFADIVLEAEAAYVWDITAKKPLYEKNAEKSWPLASITKLMTVLLSYELVADDTAITISPEAAAQQSGGTLTAGEVFKAKELADFALVSSYNSAAYTLADSVGALLGEGDSVALFVEGMNIKAEEMGLPSLKFNNPTGLDVSTTKAGAYGTAREVSLMVEYILKNYPEILIPTITPRTRVYNNAGGFHESDNTNDIITSIPNLLGSKTGYTDLAGGNLTIVFDTGFNRPVVITVLGSTHSERFTDMEKLIAAVLALHTSVKEN